MVPGLHFKTQKNGLFFVNSENGVLKMRRQSSVYVTTCDCKAGWVGSALPSPSPALGDSGTQTPECRSDNTELWGISGRQLGSGSSPLLASLPVDELREAPELWTRSLHLLKRNTCVAGLFEDSTSLYQQDFPGHPS